MLIPIRGPERVWPVRMITTYFETVTLPRIARTSSRRQAVSFLVALSWSSRFIVLFSGPSARSSARTMVRQVQSQTGDLDHSVATFSIVISWSPLWRVSIFVRQRARLFRKEQPLLCVRIY